MSELAGTASFFEDRQDSAVDKEAKSSPRDAEVHAAKVVPDEAGRLSTSSSSTDDMLSPRPRDMPVPAPDDEEEREKLASDSGYESDRRKSFSFSGAEAGGEKQTPPNEGVVDGAKDEDEEAEESSALAKAPLKSSNQESGDNPRKEPPSRPEGYPRLMPLMPPHALARAKHPVPLHPWHQLQLAMQHQTMLAHAQLVRPLPPHPALLLRQAQGTVETPREVPWAHISKTQGIPRPNSQPPTRPPVDNPKSAQPLPPVVLPLPVCCKASALGPKEVELFWFCFCP